jgi:hypothetical protein
MSLLLCRFLGIPLTPDTGNLSTDQSFPKYLLSIGSELRLQMHTTRLFLAAFGTLVLTGLLWVMAEKWQKGSKWNREDVIWMVGFGAVLGCSAILYGVGTHSAFGKRHAISEAVADVLGIGVAVAMPLVLWFRWQRPNPRSRRRNNEEPISTFHYSKTILGLQDYSPPVPMNHVTEPKGSTKADTPAVLQPPSGQPAEWLERTFHKQIEPAEVQTRNGAIVMENMNSLSINEQPITPTSQPIIAPEVPQPLASQPPAVQPMMPQPVMPQPVSVEPVTYQPSYTAQPVPTQPPVAAQPEAPQPMTAQPPAPERANVPAATFREQLSALNASWYRIEQTGKEVEDWFQRQQKRVLAQLERPAGKGHESHLELSRDFLEQKMDRVDAEWAAIRQTVREINRWLENGNSERELSQETKVW